MIVKPFWTLFLSTKLLFYFVFPLFICTFGTLKTNKAYERTNH